MSRAHSSRRWARCCLRCATSSRSREAVDSRRGSVGVASSFTSLIAHLLSATSEGGGELLRRILHQFRCSPIRCSPDSARGKPQEPERVQGGKTPRSLSEKS